MSFTLFYHPAVIDEISEVIDFYAVKKNKLYMRFGNALLQAEKTISENPLAFQKKHKQLRQYKVEGFPYLLIFQVKKQSVIFQRLIHTSRSVKTRYAKQ